MNKNILREYIKELIKESRKASQAPMRKLQDWEAINYADLRKAKTLTGLGSLSSTSRGIKKKSISFKRKIETTN